MWLAALLSGLYAMFIIRGSPRAQARRYAAIVPLAVLLVTGAVLAGCAGHMSGTPTGAAHLTITATSGDVVADYIGDPDGSVVVGSSLGVGPRFSRARLFLESAAAGHAQSRICAGNAGGAHDSGKEFKA
jgi:hypothetical protein